MVIACVWYCVVVKSICLVTALLPLFSFFLCCFLYCLPFIGELKIINVLLPRSVVSADNGRQYSLFEWLINSARTPRRIGTNYGVCNDRSVNSGPIHSPAETFWFKSMTRSDGVARHLRGSFLYAVYNLGSVIMSWRPPEWLAVFTRPMYISLYLRIHSTYLDVPGFIIKIKHGE